MRIVFALSAFLLFSVAGWAGTPLITFTPKSGTVLPTAVYPGQTVKAFYTVRNNTERTLNRLVTHGLPASVTPVTSGFTYEDGCVQPFTLAAGRACTLELNITAPVQGGPVVCLSNGISCYQPSRINILNVVEGADPRADLQSISISASSTSVAVGGQRRFTATGLYSHSTRDITGQVSWASTKSDVASIAPGGIASGMRAGVARVSASLGSLQSNSITLSVGQDSVSSAPSVTMLSPSSGTHCGGTSVTIFGTNFSDATSVWFGASQASGFSVVNDTTITAVTPYHVAGNIHVRVENASGISAETSADLYSFLSFKTGC